MESEILFMKKTKKKYIKIKWLDHKSDSSWKTKSEIKTWASKNLLCETIGRITYEDDDVIVLSASFDGEDNYGESMCIIKKNIISMK